MGSPSSLSYQQSSHEHHQYGSFGHSPYGGGPYGNAYAVPDPKPGAVPVPKPIYSYASQDYPNGYGSSSSNESNPSYGFASSSIDSSGLPDHSAVQRTSRLSSSISSSVHGVDSEAEHRSPSKLRFKILNELEKAGIKDREAALIKRLKNEPKVEIDILKFRLMLSQSDLLETQAEVASERAKLQQAQMDLQFFNSQVGSVQNELEQVKLGKRKREDDLTDLTREFQYKRSRLESSEKENDRLKANLEELEGVQARQRAEIARLTDQMESLPKQKQESAKQKEEIASLKQAVQEKEARLQQAHSKNEKASLALQLAEERRSEKDRSLRKKIWS